MVDIFKKIKDVEKPKFSMPLGLRMIRECAENNLNWHDLHIIDLFSIIYSIRIDNAKQYLQQQKRSAMQNRGISSVTKATMEDFDNL